MLEIFNKFDPDDLVIIHQEGELRRWQFRELIRLQVERFAALSLQPGSRVLLALPNSLELLVSYYACMAAGLVAVPVNERQSGADIFRIYSHAKPGLVLTSTAISARLGFEKLFPDCPIEHLEDLQEGLAGVARAEISGVMPPDDKFSDEYPAAIFYTSGSTGEPKGVVYSRKTIRENSRIFRTRFDLSGSDRSVICHCLAQNFGLVQLSIPFLDSGGSVHIVDFGNAAQTAAALAAGVTFLRLVPWFAPELLEYCLGHGVAAPALRNVIIGGDRVQSSVFELCRKALGMEAAEMFGLTETNTFCINPAKATDLKIGSIGLPMPDVQVAIRNRDGQDLQAGEIGQIWVKTPALMKEYWRDEKRTRDFISDGWVATGDAGHMDEDGYLWFNSRIRNIIIHDGDNIFPSVVEREIARHPDIGEVVVVGIPDKVHGECVGAAIVTHAGEELNMRKFRRFLHENLTETKIPTHLLVMDKYPMTKAGKADRDAIRKLIVADAMAESDLA